MSNFSNTDNVIDSRDIVARIDELEAVRDDETQTLSEEEAEELATLHKLVEAINYYADERAERGVTLIHDDHFESYMDDMLEDICAMPKNLPSYLKIEVDYDTLKMDMDYTAIDFGGETFWIR